MVSKLLLVIVALSLLCLPACYSAGKATGTAVKKTENVVKKIQQDADKFEKGYEDGIK
jgi:outer membrane biogenesis lipoprotein LolB